MAEARSESHSWAVVSQLQPKLGGSRYAGNRTLQEILKNVFDQFNNENAFGSF